ncbi:MAG: 4Fe-4S dicluster domain-containing protein [Nitrospirae bacterium]|nr:4Fe-4S dicluster domain-containing protein [Nitrospirota bacterium]
MKMTRRELLRLTLMTGAMSALGGSASLDVLVHAADEEYEGPLSSIKTGGLIRPPGALQERAFRAKCISCGVCVNVCHAMRYDAIAVAPFSSPFGKGGLRGLLDFGSPYIKDMRDFPCALCMECPKQCPAGALVSVEKEKVTMGMALIDFSLCFGWNGDVCLSCSKACPIGGKVFDFYNGEWGNQPYINERCVGCGLCVRYCPLGGSAIKVVTKRQYEAVKAAYTGDFKKLREMSGEARYNIVYGQNLPQIMARGRLVEREYR